MQHPESRRAHRVTPFHPESHSWQAGARTQPGDTKQAHRTTSVLHFPQQAMVWAHGTHGRDVTHSYSWVPEHAALPKVLGTLLQKGKQKALGSCSDILKTELFASHRFGKIVRMENTVSLHVVDVCGFCLFCFSYLRHSSLLTLSIKF